MNELCGSEIGSQVRRRRSEWKFWVCALCILGVVEVVFSLDLDASYPLVGYDIGYRLPRMIDTYHFMQTNGIGVHWWTPSYGGGMPVFAIPHSMQFSLPQFLLFVTDPWSAIEWSYCLVHALGFVGFVCLARYTFNLGFVATLGIAPLWILNGFTLGHASAGHLAYQLFPLLPLVLFVLLRPSTSRRSMSCDALCLGLLATLLPYGGGFFIAWLWVLAAVMVIMIRLLMPGPGIQARPPIVKLLIGGGIAVSISSAKLYSVAALMQQFSRAIASDGYPEGISWIEVLLWQLCGVPLTYLESIGGGEGAFRSLMVGRLSELKSASVLWFWEFDDSLPLIVWPLLAVVLFSWAMKQRTGGLSGRAWCKRYGVPLVVLLLSIWLSIELLMASGPLFSLLKEVSPLSSIHVNSRFTGALVLPLLVVAAIGLQIVCSRMTNPHARWTLAGVALLLLWPSLSGYRQVNRTLELNGAVFNASSCEDLYKRYKSDSATIGPIRHMIPDRETCDHLDRGVSALNPYEALFGYRGEEFSTPLKPGPATQIVDGKYNVHFVPALVWPEFYGREPFSQIFAGDEANLRAFLGHGETDWPLPPLQRAFDWLAVLTLLGVLATLGWLGAMRLIVYVSVSRANR